MRSSVYLVLCVHVISFRLGVCGLCRHVCYSGELLLRSVQPRDYPSVPLGLPTVVASLEREGPHCLIQDWWTQSSNSFVITLSARFKRGNCLLFPTPVVLGGLEVLLPMGALGDISTFFCVFSQASLFSFFGLPVHRGDNSGSFSCRSVMFAFLGGPHYCSVLLLCPCCIHLGWYLTSLHSFILTGC